MALSDVKFGRVLVATDKLTVLDGMTSERLDDGVTGSQTVWPVGSLLTD